MPTTVPPTRKEQNCREATAARPGGELESVVRRFEIRFACDTPPGSLDDVRLPDLIASTFAFLPYFCERALLLRKFHEFLVLLALFKDLTAFAV